MRKLSELYEMTKSECHYQDGEGFFTGLCLAVSSLYNGGKIDFEEFVLVKKDMKLTGVNSELNYWFPMAELQPRLDWLNKRIEELKKGGL